MIATRNPVPPARYSGFSLLELLVVIAIISVLAGLGSLALQSVSSKGVRGGAEVLDSLFSAARSEALLRRSETRVVIESVYDASLPDGFLRRAGIVIRDAAVDPPAWERTGSWVSLPPGAYFNPESSMSTPDGTMSGADFGLGGGTFSYFAFQPSGRRSGPARVVVSGGVVRADGTFASRAASSHGFVVYPLGQRAFLSPKAVANTGGTP